MLTLRDVGQFAARLVPVARPIMRRAYAALPASWQDTPTAWAQWFFRDAERITFVQIGAFDGVADDHLRDLIVRSKAWRGLLVEPQPAAFAKLSENYADHADRLHFLNCAISSETRPLRFYTVPEREIERLGLGLWARELATLDRTNIEKRLPEAAIETSIVEARSFDDAVRSAGLHKIDCVVIDAEGHDFEIIKGIDLNKYKVRFLIYEHAHLSEGDNDAARQLLARFGFSFRSLGYDTVAWRNHAG